MWSENRRKGPKTGCVGAERGGEGAEWEAGGQPEPRRNIPQRSALGTRQLCTNSEPGSAMGMFVLERWAPVKGGERGLHGQEVDVIYLSVYFPRPTARSNQVSYENRNVFCFWGEGNKIKVSSGPCCRRLWVGTTLPPPSVCQPLAGLGFQPHHSSLPVISLWVSLLFL